MGTAFVVARLLTFRAAMILDARRRIMPDSKQGTCARLADLFFRWLVFRHTDDAKWNMSASDMDRATLIPQGDG